MSNANNLPREVMVWLQSLGLSAQIKNPKRDICNGYLVAEAFSRYFPHALQLCTFYTGPSTDSRVKNWEVLGLFFRKQGWEVIFGKGLIHAVIECHSGAATVFLSLMYSLLTRRRMPLIPDENKMYVPHFALPTTSNLIHVAAESPQQARLLLESHKTFLKGLKASPSVAS